MFYGQYNTTIDIKGRLSLPRGLRDSIQSGEVVVMKGYEQTLYGYDKAQWEMEAQQYLKESLVDEDARTLRRRIFSLAQVIKLDDQGRVVIPQRMLTTVGIHTKMNQLVLIGAGDHFEIWHTSHWEQYKDAIE